jgi:hypothetical protein
MSDSTPEVFRHNRAVSRILIQIALRLFFEGVVHDKDKLFTGIKEVWDRFTPRKKLVYGSREYYEHLAGMDPARQEHYRLADHHPEHFPNGVNGMTLVGLCVYFADNVDTCRQHGDGNIANSFRINERRHKYGKVLEDIFINTARELELL